MLEEYDIELTRLWRNQDGIRHWFVNSEIISPEQQKDWWKHYLVRDNDLMFIIEWKRENRPIGTAALYEIDRVARSAKFGRLMIGEMEARGKGLAKEATWLLCKFGLENLSLEQIYIEILSHNYSVFKKYLDVGYAYQGNSGGLIKMAVNKGTIRKPSIL